MKQKPNLNDPSYNTCMAIEENPFLHEKLLAGTSPVETSKKGDTMMTPEQKKFSEEVWEISPTLGRWVTNKFINGFSIAEVKKMLLDAAAVAGRY
jgi:hypothetical protein